MKGLGKGLTKAEEDKNAVVDAFEDAIQEIASRLGSYEQAEKAILKYALELAAESLT